MVRILDTTLREGEQTPGVCFDNHIKLAIADMLDHVGVDIIETGHPVVTAEIEHSVRQIASRGLAPLIGAHARSLRRDIDVALNCGVGFLGIFYCVSNDRLQHHQTTLPRVIEKITEMVAYARSGNPRLRIRYTPEDTVRSEWENVVEAASEAVRAGADIISVADTTGYMIPGTKRSMYDYVSRLRDDLAVRSAFPQIAVHCHNDRGLALANALDGYRAGAEIIDATVLGLGERAGLVDLATLLAVLQSDFNEGQHWNLRELPRLYDTVSRYAGMEIPPLMPLSGKNVFTHCAGIHTQAALKNPLHYQSLDPGIIGREAEIALDHMSGNAAVLFALEKIGRGGLSPEHTERVIGKVKETGRMGRVVNQDELRHIVNFITNERENPLDRQPDHRLFTFADPQG